MGTMETAREELLRFLGTISRAGQTLDGVGDETNLVDAGIIDSLAMVQIILHLETSHSVDLRMGKVDPNELATIGGILGTIERAGK